jgi:hypothetical protein
LTFSDAAEKVRDGESGHPQVAITDLGMVPVERLHPKGACSSCRPVARVADEAANSRFAAQRKVVLE